MISYTPESPHIRSTILPSTCPATNRSWAVEPLKLPDAGQRRHRLSHAGRIASSARALTPFGYASWPPSRSASRHRVSVAAPSRRGCDRPPPSRVPE